MRILLVDDDEDVSGALVKILTHAGHEVATARNGTEGLAQFRNGEFDAVLSDWNMPFMNGYRMVTEILKLSPTTKVVMMSADGSNRPPTGVPLLQKPFSREILLETMFSKKREEN
jgi:DNA-binding response OmpR family regulator